MCHNCMYLKRTNAVINYAIPSDEDVPGFTAERRELFVLELEADLHGGHDAVPHAGHVLTAQQTHQLDYTPVGLVTG